MRPFVVEVNADRPMHPDNYHWFDTLREACEWAKGWPLSGAKVYKVLEVAHYEGRPRADAVEPG